VGGAGRGETSAAAEQAPRPGRMSGSDDVPVRPPPLPSRRRRFPWVVIAVPLLAAGASVLYSFNPSTSRLFPPCPFHAVTGLYCPGCGSTRAMHQLLHGHVATAFDFNPLVVVALPLVGLALAWQALRPRRTAPAATAARLPGWWVWALLLVVVVFGIVRNLPWKPVRWMAP
jgi:Protein of unknown function (DUF2752)